MKRSGFRKLTIEQVRERQAEKRSKALAAAENRRNGDSERLRAPQGTWSGRQHDAVGGTRKTRPTKPRKPINKRGRRTRTWESVWRWLKPRLEAAGRDHCEFVAIDHECNGYLILDPCHSKKRRLWQGDDIYKVAIGCRNVHDYLDLELSHEAMEDAVMMAIANNGGLILPNG